MTLTVPRSAVPRVSIIIPAGGSIDLLGNALASLVANAPTDIPFETIVVMNGADAADVEQLGRSVDGVDVIATAVNVGLAGAGNLGRERASGQLLVLLHDDAEVEPGWLEALVALADQRADAGAIGSRVLFMDGRLQNAGSILWSDGTTSVPWADEPPSAESFTEVRAVDYSGTSSLLVRADVWDAIGGLDDSFFPVYYVDVDLAMRVRQCGLNVLYQPSSVIRHHQGASGSNLWRHFVADRNRRRFVEKWADDLQQQPARSNSFEHAIAMASATGESRRARFVGMVTDGLRPPARLANHDAALRDLQREYIQHLERELLAHVQQVELLEQAVAESEARRAATTYRLGTRLTFSATGNAARFLRSGGHSPEDWGMWIGATPFEIELSVVTDAHQGMAQSTVIVEIEATHFFAARRASSSFQVRVNDVVADLTESEPGEHIYQLPGAVMDGRMRVAVASQEPVSPASIGLGPDERTIGVGLIAMTVMAVDPSRAPE